VSAGLAPLKDGVTGPGEGPPVGACDAEGVEGPGRNRQSFISFDFALRPGISIRIGKPLIGVAAAHLHRKDERTAAHALRYIRGRRAGLEVVAPIDDSRGPALLLGQPELQVDGVSAQKAQRITSALESGKQIDLAIGPGVARTKAWAQMPLASALQQGGETMPSASATCRTMAHASFEASEWMRSVARVDRASRPRCGFRS